MKKFWNDTKTNGGGMPAISFSTMKDKILSGEKKQTIRPKSDYWFKWKEGDRLVGYWKMRSSGESEKLFDSELSEDPFVTTPDEWTVLLAIQDGFEGRTERIEGQTAAPYTHDTPLNTMTTWFYKQYGEGWRENEYVVLRWN